MHFKKHPTWSTNQIKTFVKYKTRLYNGVFLIFQVRLSLTEIESKTFVKAKCVTLRHLTCSHYTNQHVDVYIITSTHHFEQLRYQHVRAILNMFYFLVSSRNCNNYTCTHMTWYIQLIYSHFVNIIVKSAAYLYTSAHDMIHVIYMIYGKRLSES